MPQLMMHGPQLRHQEHSEQSATIEEFKHESYGFQRAWNSTPQSYLNFAAVAPVARMHRKPADRLPKERGGELNGMLYYSVMKNPAPRFADSREPHAHQRCIDQAMRLAQDVCRERGLLLTPTRKRVLELVWQRHAPIGAYDILRRLSSEGKSVAPPTVYRALTFLLDAGLIHRIETLNAYLACETPRQPHSAQFLVCRSCHCVSEFDDSSIVKLLARKAKSAGFTVDARDVEIKGLCASCHGAPAPTER